MHGQVRLTRLASGAHASEIGFPKERNDFSTRISLFTHLVVVVGFVGPLAAAPLLVGGVVVVDAGLLAAALPPPADVQAHLQINPRWNQRRSRRL
jgi:hypothetical protein